MRNTAVQTWKTCLQRLQQLTHGPTDPEAIGEVSAKLLILTDEVDQCQDASPATLTKLVKEMEVPYHISKACYHLAQHAPRSTGVYAAATLLSKLVAQLSADEDEHGLFRTIIKQLESSELCEWLPALCRAASVELMEQTRDKSFLKYGALYVAGKADNHQMYAINIRHCAERLLTLFFDHLFFWPSELLRLRAAAAITPAAMNLAVAAFQHVSAEVEQQEHASLQLSFSNSFDMKAVLRAAFFNIAYFGHLWRRVDVGSGGSSTSRLPLRELEPVLHSPSVTPCSVLLLAVCSFGLELKGTAELKPCNHFSDDSSSGSSSNRGSSSGGGAKSGKKKQRQQQRQQPLPGIGHGNRCPCCVDKLIGSWKEACQYYDALTPCHHHLFDVLGVNGRTVLWAAAIVKPRCYMTTFGDLLAPYMARAKFTKTMGSRVLGKLVLEQQHTERQLHLLMPSVLLHHPAALPAAHGHLPECSLTAAQCSTAALTTAQHMATNLESDETDPWLQRRLHPALVDEVIPMICKLTAAVLQHVPGSPGAAADAAAIAAVEASGRGSSSSGGCSCCRPDSVGSFAVRALSHLALLLAEVMARAVWRRPRFGGSPDAHEGLKLLLESLTTRGRSALSDAQIENELYCVTGLPKHAVQVLTALERFVRHTAAAADTLIQANSPSQVVVMELTKLMDGPDKPLIALAAAAGPSSPAHRQLYSLLCSMAKLASSISRCTWPHAQALASVCVTAIALCARMLLTDSGAQAAAMVEAAALTGRREPVNGSSLGLLHGEDDQAAPWLCCPTDVMGSAVVFGRVCLVWAQSLQQELPTLIKHQEKTGQPVEAAALSFNSGTSGVKCPLPACCMCLEPAQNGLAHVRYQADTYQAWLALPQVEQQLAAAGVSTNVLLRQHLAFCAAHSTAMKCTSGTAECLEAFRQQLEALGDAYSTLPLTFVCNNPRCSNVSGGSEQQAASGKGSVCSGCRAARYCCKACQQQHWKLHKPVCKAIAGGAGAGTSAAGKDQQVPGGTAAAAAAGAGTSAAATAEGPAAAEQEVDEFHDCLPA